MATGGGNGRSYRAAIWTTLGAATVAVFIWPGTGTLWAINNVAHIWADHGLLHSQQARIVSLEATRAASERSRETELTEVQAKLDQVLVLMKQQRRTK